MNEFSQRLVAISQRVTSVPPVVCHSLATVLLLVGCYQLALLTWQLWPDASDPLPVATVPAATGPSSPDLSVLKKLHLFGKAQSAASAQADAPTTQLPIRLTGVMYSSDEHKALAVISRASQQYIYGVGETIDGTQAKILHIYPYYIVLQRDGHQERLELPQSQLDRQAALPRISTPTSSYPPLVSQQLAQLLADPGQFNQFIQIIPKRDQGRLLGYQLQPGPHPQLFNQLGFKPGDLAIAINGHSLNDTREIVKIYRHFSANSSYQVELIRQGVHLTVNVNLPAPASEENPS
ncbi:type II secretion system protein GspC [Celerinatantimonas sp. YJH-8]|uniref:type II secretion system protein GspC n=1 Tax=Celerinatantimonas sp. YJH-8 TaxID=3228714 RepID=UPI0038C331BA